MRMGYRTLFALFMMIAAGGTAMAADQIANIQGYGGVPIEGTLVLPPSADADHPVAAVLLLQGSGPTDRNGNQPPHFETNVLRELAQILAAEGIASLRFDKRGLYANRESLPTHSEEWPAFFSWEAATGDARAAFAWLAAQPGVARDRMAVFGHSEGGLIALDWPSASEPKRKTLILAGTPARPLGEVLHEQLAALLDRQHATPEARKFFLDADDRIRAEILKTGKVPLDVPAGLAAFYPPYLGPFLKSVFSLDPIALAANFQGPILVINGGADVQVSAERDAGRFAAAFASRHDGSEVLTPDGVSHNLKTVSGNNPGMTGPIDPRVKDAIVAYLKKTL